MIQAIWYYQSPLTVCAKMREGEGAIDAVPALIHLLQDRDVDVRRDAAGALGQIGTPEALKAVEECQSP